MDTGTTLRDRTAPTLYGPLPDVSSMTELNEFFDTNLPLFEASASAARSSAAGDTQGLALPSLAENVQMLKKYIDRRENRTLTEDELAAYAQLSVWHDKHAEALGGFYGSFTEARRVLSVMERQAVQEFIEATSFRATTEYPEVDPTTPWLEVPTDLVQDAKTCLRQATPRESGQLIYLGNGTFRRQSSYDASSTAPANIIDSAPSTMCINHFAAKDDQLKKVYQSQLRYMSAFDRYSQVMYPVTMLQEAVRERTQPGYSAARFGDVYEHQPAITERKQAVLSEWEGRGYSVKGPESVVLPSEDPEVDAGEFWAETQ